MPKLISVGTICVNLASLARSHGYDSLSGWLKLAANEAYLHKLSTEARVDDRIGVWDWDIGNDRTHLNSVGGAFFGRSERAAAIGAPLECYTSLVHEHDTAHFSADIARSVESGGAFYSEYRIIVHGQLRWLRADGNCCIDDAGRPIRMLGSLVDITREKLGLTTRSVE